MEIQPTAPTPRREGTPRPPSKAQKSSSRLSQRGKSVDMKADRVIKIRAVMIDLGTGYCKAGYTGLPLPSVVLPSTMGRPVQMGTEPGDNRQENFVGEVLAAPEPALKLASPLRHGIVADWDGAEALLAHIFHRALRILPEEHAVMVADPPLSPASNREKMAEVLFETFGAPSIHVADQSVLSLYSSGCITGLVVECGHGVTHVAPVHEGYIMPHVTARADYGGADLNDYLLQLLNEAGHRFTEAGLHIVEDIKKKCCYTSVNFEEELGLDVNEHLVEYELPDGYIVSLGKERFRCPEALFKPSLMGSKEPGVHSLALHSLDSCDSPVKDSIASNILVCGGSTMFGGFSERLQKEMDRLGSGRNPAVRCFPARKYSVWLGGSILASLQAFQQLWVHRREYDEWGPFIIHRKCFSIYSLDV
ncbi:actin-like protein 7B [Narcine bancroftii]|uniref:actin-like protein 7B n=1 Tax=Narcine bancroftii TaxID=1343680 RepID=UPI003831D08C